MEVSRRVNGQRRVSLPVELAAACGISSRSWVSVGIGQDRKWALVVRAVPAPLDPGSAAVRDPDRPRMVTKVMQVTLPKVLMEHVGMRPGDWVFVGPLGEGRGLRVVSQSKVRLRELPESRSNLVSGRTGGVAGGGS